MENSTLKNNRASNNSGYNNNDDCSGASKSCVKVTDSEFEDLIIKFENIVMSYDIEVQRLEYFGNRLSGDGIVDCDNGERKANAQPDDILTKFRRIYDGLSYIHNKIRLENEKLNKIIG